MDSKALPPDVGQKVGKKRGPSTFKQRDITAAVKAVRAGGCVIVRVEVGPDGRIVVVTDGASDSTPLTENPWDTI